MNPNQAAIMAILAWWYTLSPDEQEGRCDCLLWLVGGLAQTGGLPPPEIRKRHEGPPATHPPPQPAIPPPRTGQPKR